MNDRRSRSIDAQHNRIVANYQTQHQTLQISGIQIDLALPADIDAVLENGNDPYWAELWGSSVALAEHLAYDFKGGGKQVLELGCGVGLAGITACKLGAEVLLTDYNRDALAFAQYNLRLNQCRTARVCYLDWYAPRLSNLFDTILASDVIYDSDKWEALLAVWDTALEPDGQVLLTEPCRHTAPPFLELITEQGFVVGTTYHRVVQHDGPCRVDIHTIHRSP